MLREPAEPAASEPKQSGSFRYLQGMLEAGEGGKIPNTLPPHLPFPHNSPVHPSLPTPADPPTPSSQLSLLNLFLCLHQAFTF